jgi:hypothetical protein
MLKEDSVVKKNRDLKNGRDLKKDLETCRYIKSRALVHALKKRHWPSFDLDNNIVGAAFGRRVVNGEMTDEPALIVYVVRKVSRDYLPLSRLLPRRMYIGGDYVEVDVVETGPFYPLTFNGHERPATLGISIGNANEPSAGTLGAVVIDNTDRSQCILSNNHVLARQNAAALGEMIIQPGVFDAGSSPADDIATLKRFVTINATGNTVDGAIAQILEGLVTNRVHDDIIPVASPDHPAVGLLFAGSCSRTVMNPIADVLNQLNIRFPTAGSTAIAELGMKVEKVGRTTEYTTSSVTEIDATVTIAYDFGNATFDNQFTTAWMSNAGDSGSVVYQGGEGGNENQCGSCGSTSSASRLMGVNLHREQEMAKMVRDQFLRHTRIGRWAIDLFYANEARALQRLADTKIERNDREYARQLFSQYREDGYAIFAQGEKSNLTLTEHHLKDAKSALKRAEKYLEKDEVHAADELLELVKKHGLGKNVREILALLNDEMLAKQVKDIMGKVKFIQSHEGRCCN